MAEQSSTKQRPAWDMDILGRGFDGSVSSRHAGFLDVLIRPESSLLDETELDEPYKKVKHNHKSMQKLRADFTSHIGSGEVRLELGVDSISFCEEEDDVTAIGEMIHTRTIGFKPQLSSQTDSLEAGLLERELYKLASQKHVGARDELEMRKAVCKQLIDGEKVRGSTHFVSKVELGAKVVEIRKTARQETDEVVPVGLNVQSIQEAGRSSSNVVSIVGEGVVLDGNNTEVNSTQERVIGLELSPITVLVRDSRWKEALQQVCMDYLETEKDQEQGADLQSRDGPFLLATHKFWLVADPASGRLLATDRESLASEFYIHVNPSKRTYQDAETFTIEYRGSGPRDERLFVSLTSSAFFDNKEVKLVRCPDKESVTFSLAHLISDANTATREEWKNEPLLVFRTSSDSSWLGRQFLAVDDHQVVEEPTLLVRFGLVASSPVRAIGVPFAAAALLGKRAVSWLSSQFDDPPDPLHGLELRKKEEKRAVDSTDSEDSERAALYSVTGCAQLTDSMHVQFNLIPRADKHRQKKKPNKN